MINMETILDAFWDVSPIIVLIEIIVWGFSFVFRLLFLNENITYKNNDYIIYDDEIIEHQENNNKVVCEYCNTIYENNLNKCPNCNASN